jgi:predicted TIM-barrel fold metal-dependent hydrolase
MYFWDGSNYADMEFSNDGRVTLCFNLEQSADAENDDLIDPWRARGPRRVVEGYAVEPDEQGLRSAVKAILKHVKRMPGTPA